VRQHPYKAADWDTSSAASWRVALPKTPSFGPVQCHGSDGKCHSLNMLKAMKANDSN